ncbi:alanine racemase [Gordonia alkaliphila]|uniref:alanine racemase n=1 Tax=Gordonia alkaliphila TaxID=1053547 RepID=UPI001FF41B4A|nr:alanine racemase [Gordonia alkaliphila]MCK0439992.1 alanine racemase [Gordonia alkaliphila]
MTDTPYLLVDDAVLRRNVAALAERAAASGLQVRPHAKTHKCAQVAARQRDPGPGLDGAVGFTVATISEAEAFADAGFTDLFLAYPLWLTESKAARLRSLAQRAALRLAVDSAAGAQRMAELLGDAPVEVLVEVDSGMRRSGAAPDDAGAVAAAAVAAGLSVIGVFTFPGHGYGPGSARADAARQEAVALAAAADSLRRTGIEPTVISGGSTPTIAFADAGVLTEIRPGVYPFNDAQQLELGSCTWDDIALVAVATVIRASSSPGESPRLVLDAGSKTLGADRPAWASGFGRLLDHPDARIVALSEHHAVVEFPPAEFPTVEFPTGAKDVPALGDRVRVVPNHVCSAVNLADELLAETADGVEHWPIIARGANH